MRAIMITGVLVLTTSLASPVWAQEVEEDREDEEIELNPPDDPVEVEVIDPAERARLAVPERRRLPGVLQIVDEEGRMAAGWRSERTCPSTLDAGASMSSDEGSEGLNTAISEAASTDTCIDVILRDRPGMGPEVAAAGRAMGPGYMRTGRGQEIIYLPPPPARN